MSHRLTILGCGPSGGVPRLGPNWGACDPSNPKNRRRRCAVLIEKFDGNRATRALIDTPPDLREQLLSAHVTALDGVVYTHDHADHTHGIDDLRPICYAMKSRVNVYFDKATGDSLKSRFAYCFAPPPELGYAPMLKSHDLVAGDTLDISGPAGTLALQTIPQLHGGIETLGIRVGNVGYSPDISDFPAGSAEMMQGLDVWIVDALRKTPHPSHFNVAKALEWIERLKPKRAILTHMTTELDYDALKRELPAHVEPGYDGMEIHFD